MNHIICPVCAAEVPDDGRATLLCGQCGIAVRTPPVAEPPPRRWRTKDLANAMAFLAVGVIVSIVGGWMLLGWIAALWAFTAKPAQQCC